MVNGFTVPVRQRGSLLFDGNVDMNWAIWETVFAPGLSWVALLVEALTLAVLLIIRSARASTAAKVVFMGECIEIEGNISCRI